MKIVTALEVIIIKAIISAFRTFVPLQRAGFFQNQSKEWLSSGALT